MPRITITLPDGDELKFPLHDNSSDDILVRIGRMPDCDIVIPLPSVSGLHATITRNSSGYVLKDAGSTNGLIIDGEREDSVFLRPGKTVLIGEAVLRYEDDKPKEEEIASKWEESSEDSGEFSGLGAAAFDDEGDDLNFPDAKPLHYDGSESSGDEEDDGPVQPRRVVAKSYYLTIVLYTIVVFAVAFTVGIIYKHYVETGELLPYKWMGIESPKEKFIKESTAELQKATDAPTE